MHDGLYDARGETNVEDLSDNTGIAWGDNLHVVSPWMHEKILEATKLPEAMIFMELPKMTTEPPPHPVATVVSFPGEHTCDKCGRDDVDEITADTHQLTLKGGMWSLFILIALCKDCALEEGVGIHG